MKFWPSAIGLTWVLCSMNVTLAQNPPDVSKVIVPFVQKHCVECHGPKNQEAEIALHAFDDETSIIKGRKTWTHAIRLLQAGEMPPERATLARQSKNLRRSLRPSATSTTGTIALPGPTQVARRFAASIGRNTPTRSAICCSLIGRSRWRPTFPSMR